MKCLIAVECCDKCLIFHSATSWLKVSSLCCVQVTVSVGAALIPSLPLLRIDFMDH